MRVKINVPLTILGRGYWKLNSHPLEDINISDSFCERWATWKNYNTDTRIFCSRGRHVQNRKFGVFIYTKANGKDTRPDYKNFFLFVYLWPSGTSWGRIYRRYAAPIFPTAHPKDPLYPQKLSTGEDSTARFTEDKKSVHFPACYSSIAEKTTNHHCNIYHKRADNNNPTGLSAPDHGTF